MSDASSLKPPEGKRGNSSVSRNQCRPPTGGSAAAMRPACRDRRQEPSRHPAYGRRGSRRTDSPRPDGFALPANSPHLIDLHRPKNSAAGKIVGRIRSHGFRRRPLRRLGRGLAAAAHRAAFAAGLEDHPALPAHEFGADLVSRAGTDRTDRGCHDEFESALVGRSGADGADGGGHDGRLTPRPGPGREPRACRRSRGPPCRSRGGRASG